MRPFLRYLVLGCVALALGAPVWAAGWTPLPTITQGKGEECVEPTPDMRRNHMKYLLHKRDQTMHQGIRTKQYSLKECIGCHAKKDAQGRYLPVNGEDQFCGSCHGYAAVSLDCFECHATRPSEN